MYWETCSVVKSASGIWRSVVFDGATANPVTGWRPMRHSMVIPPAWRMTFAIREAESEADVFMVLKEW
jgi:hypothetical protein